MPSIAFIAPPAKRQLHRSATVERNSLAHHFVQGTYKIEGPVAPGFARFPGWIFWGILRISGDWLLDLPRPKGTAMVGTQDSGTRITLLGRLRRDPGDQAAWGEFVEQYGPKIYGWCRKWNLQEADAQDVAQNVLLKLAEKLREFQYDPSLGSFRAWIKTLTHHAWSDFLKSRQRPGLGSGDSHVNDMLQSVAARDDLVQRLEEEFDRELLQEAMARVRLRVAPQTWKAFVLTALEGLSGAEAAEQIPMQPAQVFVAKRRVQKLLQEEIVKLEQNQAA
jgi:RNA polymerase sigma factor (sigma-70 family)